MSTRYYDSKAYSIGTEVRSKLLCHLQYLMFIMVILEAKFVNPKIVTYVPGPGAHEINDVYTTKEHSKQFWSINRNDRHRQSRPIKHPGP